MGPFFVIDQSLKVNAARNQSHLKKELFHAVKKVYKKDDWVLKQYESLSHRPNILKGFLKETLNEGSLSQVTEAVVRRCYVKKGVLLNFAKFVGKHLCQSLFFHNKAAGLIHKLVWQLKESICKDY